MSKIVIKTQAHTGRSRPKYGFYYRYDTTTELELMTTLWSLVNDRLNYFITTKKPTGYYTDAVGRRKRVYDTPRTPFARLLAFGILSPDQVAELEANKASLDPVVISDEIGRMQQRLIKLAAGKTARMEREIEVAKALPDSSGARVIRCPERYVAHEINRVRQNPRAAPPTNNLQPQRIALGLTMTAAAMDLGVWPTTIQRIE